MIEPFKEIGGNKHQVTNKKVAVRSAYNHDIMTRRSLRIIMSDKRERETKKKGEELQSYA